MLRNKFKANTFETCLAIFTFLSLLLFIFVQFDLLSPTTKNNPFKEYYSNYWIRIIFVFTLFTRALFIVTFLLLAFKEKKNYFINVVYLISAFIIGFLQWFELYYGSTFYYGEVRDKQGLSFPFLSAAMFTLIIWKPYYGKQQGKDFAVKITFSVLLYIGLFLLWQYAHEAWNLYQS